MKLPLKVIMQTVDILAISEGWRATNYLSEKSVVRATRRAYKGKFSHTDNIEIVLAIGRPNYAEREFIKTCKKAKQGFPLKKVLIKYLPKKK